MSLKLNYDKLRHDKQESKSSDVSSDKSYDIEKYAMHGNVRNVCFYLDNGEQQFLNYAYLITGVLSEDHKVLALTFTTHTVMMKGHFLEGLRKAFMAQLPREVRTVEERYAMLEKKEVAVVTSIFIQTKDVQ